MSRNAADGGGSKPVSTAWVRRSAQTIETISSRPEDARTASRALPRAQIASPDHTLSGPVNEGQVLIRVAELVLEWVRWLVLTRVPIFVARPATPRSRSRFILA